MAWRPTNYLIEGLLDNTKLGKVTGWMQFAGKKERIVLDLTGDFHRDIRGAKIYFRGQADAENVDAVKAAEYMKGFSLNQTGKVGDITAGFAPADYVAGRVYLEWYSEANGRVVIELPQENIKVIGKPVPWEKCEPVSREEQAKNMAEFLQGLAEKFKIGK